MRTDASAYLNAGLDAILTKPVMLPSLKTWLREAVARRQRSSELAIEEIAG